MPGLVYCYWSGAPVAGLVPPETNREAGGETLDKVPGLVHCCWSDAPATGLVPPETDREAGGETLDKVPGAGRYVEHLTSLQQGVPALG